MSLLKTILVWKNSCILLTEWGSRDTKGITHGLPGIVSGAPQQENEEEPPAIQGADQRLPKRHLS